MNSLAKYVALLLLPTLIVSCNQNTEERKNSKTVENLTSKTFNKKKWKIKDGSNYPHREEMLHDLVYNVPLKGKGKAEIIELLGEPDRIDNNHLFYIVGKQSVGFITLNQKTLVLKLNDEGVVEWRKIKE